MSVDDATLWRLLNEHLPIRGLGQIVADYNLDARFVYVMGGRPGATSVTVDRFDVLTKRWAPMPPMPTARTYGCAEIVGEKAYAIGGCNGSDVVNSMDSFDMHSEEWQPGLPMTTLGR